jgi:C1A family cysteine protease
LKKIDVGIFNDKSIPRKMDLRSEQSSVKNQGQRGSCTYFVMSSLLESLIIQKQKTEIDISEEYMAWAGKVKNKLRMDEEDSSIAVNASTVQKFGLMLEKDLPYQISWFNQGMPCELQKDKKIVDPICYSHKGPIAKNKNKVIDGSNFIFEAVDSGSADVILSRFFVNQTFDAII